MEVGGVNFKVNLDLGDLDKQLSKAQNLIKNSKVDFNIGEFKGAPKIEKSITNLVRERNIFIKVDDSKAKKSLKDLSGYTEAISGRISIPVNLDSAGIISETTELKKAISQEFASKDFSIPFSFSEKQVEEETQKVKKYLQKELSLKNIIDEKAIDRILKGSSKKEDKSKEKKKDLNSSESSLNQIEIKKLTDVVSELKKVNLGISSLNKNTKPPNIILSALSSALGNVFSGAFSKLGSMLLSALLEKLGFADEVSNVKIKDEKVTSFFDKVIELLELIKKDSKPSLLKNFIEGLAEGGGKFTAEKGLRFLEKFDFEAKIKLALEKGKDFAGVFGDFGKNLYKESGLENLNKQFKESFSKGIISALEESISQKELFTNLAKNIGKSFFSEEVLDAAKKAAIGVVNPKSYINASGITDDKKNLSQALGLARGEKETALQTPIVRAIGKVIAPIIDKNLKQNREQNLREKAIPLVLKRATKILQDTEIGTLNQEAIEAVIARSNRVRGRMVNGVDAGDLMVGRIAGVDAPTAILPETKELIITIGGYAGDAQNLTGLRIAGDLIYKFSELGKKDTAAIGVKNPDGNIKNKAKDNPKNKAQSILSALLKPHIRGYSEDAVEMASQALSAILASPDLKVKFLGESGGGFAAEEATQILNLMGFAKNISGAGFGTPNLIGGSDLENFKKYLGKNPEETLGYEVHSAYAPAGFADVSAPEQNLIGLSGHPYEHYATTEAFKAFVHNKNKATKESDPEINKQIISQIEAEIEQIKIISKDITKIPLESSAEIKNYLKNIVDSLLSLEIDEEIFGEEKVTKIKQDSQEIINSINTELKNIEFLTPYKNALSRGGQALESLSSPDMEEIDIKNLLKNLEKESAKIQIALLEVAQSGTTDAQKNLTEHFKDFQKRVKNLSLASREEINLDAITVSTENRFQELLKDFDSDLANRYVSAINEVVDAFDIETASNPDFSNSNLEKLRNIAKTIEEMIPESAEEVVEEVLGEGVNINPLGDEIEEVLNPGRVNDRVETLENSILGLIETIENRISGIGNSISSSLDNFYNSISVSFGNIEGGLSGLIENIELRIENLNLLLSQTSVSQALRNIEAEDEDENSINEIDILSPFSEREYTAEWAQESINEYLSSLSDQSEILSEINRYLERISPEKILKDYFKSIQVANLRDILENRLKTRGFKLQDFDLGDFEDIDDVNRAAQVALSGSELSGVILESAIITPDIYEKISQLSKNTSSEIISGFLSGFSKEEVAELALSTAEEFMTVMESEFQIRSPSRWAYKIGKFIIEGFSEGIGAGRGLINSAIENIVEPTRESLLEYIHLGQGGLGSIGEQGAGLVSNGLNSIGNLAQEFFDDSGIGDLGSEIGENLGPGISGILEDLLNPLSNFRDKAIELLSAPFLFVASASFLSDFNAFLFDISKEGFNLAVEFERISTATGFILGSARKAQEKIKTLRDSARDLGLSEKVVENYNQLAAATRNTSLEGKDTDVIADALNHAAAAFSLSEEQTQGAYIAVQQIAGKGTVSAEELRGQLAERIPGAFQIAARAMKVSEQELFQLMSSGSLSASDFLPALGRQLKIETMGGVQEASKTTFAMMQKMENSLNRIRLSLGEKLIPAAKIALTTINAGLGFLSGNLDAILNTINTGLLFALSHSLTILAPIIKGLLAKSLLVIAPILSTITAGFVSLSSAASLFSGIFSALNNSVFLKAALIIEGVKTAYSFLRTILGAFNLSDSPLFAEQTVWDDLAKRIKTTVKSIKTDLKDLDKGLDTSFANRKLEHKGFIEKTTNLLVNDNPLYNLFLSEEDIAKKREKLSKKSIWNWTPFDRQGKLASFASMREDSYVMDLQERSSEIDKILNAEKIIESATLAKQGKGGLVGITNLDKEISRLTTIKSLLEVSDIEKREALTKEIRKIQEEREALSLDYVAAQTGYLDYIKVIDAELESVTDPQAINQLTVAKASAQKILDLMAKYEAENGPINVVKKFALALQELDFAFESISQRAEKATISIQRGFAKQKLEEFNTNFFAESELSLKESNARLKIIETETEITKKTLKQIVANLENSPAYSEALNYIKKEEEELGRILNAADIEYLKQKTASSEDQNLVNAFDAEIKIRIKEAELEQKLLEKDELALEIQAQRQTLALEKLDRQKEINDISHQLAEAQNREMIAEMSLAGKNSSDINAIQSLQNTELLKGRQESLKLDKKGIENAFKNGSLSVREYESRVNQLNLELANLNAELKEAKVATEEALSDRLLTSIEEQVAAIDFSLSVAQVKRESNDLKSYEKDITKLSQAHISLNQAIRSGENEISDLNAQLFLTKENLKALTSSGIKTESVRDRMLELRNQIEIQTEELVRAQIQSNQAIKAAQEEASLYEIDRIFNNSQHLNSIRDLDAEYGKLSNELKKLEAKNTSPQINYEEKVSLAKEGVKKLNRELEITQELLFNLENSNIQTPEVRDRIEDISKQIEIKEREVFISRKQADIEIFNAREEMLAEIQKQEEEMLAGMQKQTEEMLVEMQKQAEELLKIIESQDKAFQHNSEIEDLNREYTKIKKEFQNLGNKDPILAFKNSIEESEGKVFEIERNIQRIVKNLKTLEKSSLSTDIIKDKEKELKEELEVQEIKLKIAKVQKDIDYSEGKESLKETTEELIKQNKELEKIVQNLNKVEEKISLINTEQKRQEEFFKNTANEHSQSLDTLSEINSLFKEINIESQNLFDLEKAMSRERAKVDIKDLKKRFLVEEDLLELTREKQVLENKKSDIDAVSKIEEAQRILEEAKLGKDVNSIKNAEESLRLLENERRVLLDNQKTQSIIYSKEKGILALRAESEIKLKKTEIANQAFKDALESIVFSVQKINKQFEKQSTYLNSYKDLFSSQANFLQDFKDFEIKELDFARNIIGQLKQEEISPELRKELESQLKMLGINPSSTEADILLKSFEIENELAEERLKTLKQQQEIEKTLLDIDLRKAELDARSAVVQAKVLEAWGNMIGGVDSSSLVEEAIENLNFTQKQGDLARQSQTISQSAEINQMSIEDWFRQLQRRQEVVTAEGYNGGLGRLGKKPKLQKPDLKLPKLENEFIKTDNFNEGLVFNKEGFGGRIGELLKEQLEFLGPNLNTFSETDYKDQRFKESPSIPNFSPLTERVTETNKILSDMRNLIKEQNDKKQQSNVELTVVSSDAVVDAGKLLNDITRPF